MNTAPPESREAPTPPPPPPPPPQSSPEFGEQYGATRSKFSPYSLEHTLERARYYTQINSDADKLVGLYVYHKDDPNTPTFFSEVLTQECVAKFLENHYVLWKWNLKHHRTQYSVVQEVTKLIGTTAVAKIKDLPMHQLPLLITVTRTSIHADIFTGWEVISIVQGNCSLRDLMISLEASKALHDAQNIITRQKEEEASVSGDTLVNFETSREKERVKDTAWAIPLSWKYKGELAALREHKFQQEQEQRDRHYAWQKVITKAIEEGKDEATIREIIADEKDLTVKSPVNFNETCCLMTLAAWEGHDYLVPILLKVGLSLEGSGTSPYTPLTAAATRGHAKMVEALLSHGADCLAKSVHSKKFEHLLFGHTALHIAAYHGHQDCVSLLIKATLAATDNNLEDITDTNGCTPVHSAAILGHWEVVDQLKDAGWNLNTIDKQGNTPLHMAACKAPLDLVKLLVAAGLNIHLKNKRGKTPLSIAEQHGNHEVANWIVKSQTGRFQHRTTLADTLQTIRIQIEEDQKTYGQYMDAIKCELNIEILKRLLEENDPHLVDREGRTALHVMAQTEHMKHLPMLSLNLGHHHVLTHQGDTPLDLARRCSHQEIVQLLETHQCAQVEGSSEELYEKLLKVIAEGDDAQEASRLLCAGAPMELSGDLTGSALRQAVTSDRFRITNLLLASGASIIASSEGYNLLQQAWHSTNTSARVLASVTKAFSRQLKRERDRLLRSSIKGKGFRDDLAELIEMVDGDTPFWARWPEEGTTKGRTERRTMAKLTDFMVSAARANCPLIVSFLRWAGAWPFFSKHRGTTALHAALKAGQLGLVETMVRDLGASLYIPDSTNILPKDMKQMPTHLLTHLELLMYWRERKQLKELKEQKKDQSELMKVKAVIRLQKILYERYRGDHSEAGQVSQAAGGEALLIASRVGLLQLLYLLLTVAHLPPDTVVDVVCGTTALHEAAAHGKSGCVAQLLSALQDAATHNAGNVTAIAAAATTSADNPRLDRYSPLHPDKYGQTALHLAAMFGHKHTLELLFQIVGQDPPCRAGTVAKKVEENFTGYLRRYRRYNDDEKEAPSPLDQGDAPSTLKRILKAVDIAKLPNDARKANVDFSEHEAKRVKDAVLRVAGVLLGRAAVGPTPYMGGRALKLMLVGSGRDGSKMFCPDEFDVNVVIAAGESVSVSVVPKTNYSPWYKGHTLKIEVETKEPHLQGTQLAQDLYEAVSEALTDCVLDDKRLSVVPPGLTKTRVGVALSLAWQGEQYPLLLVGVDLVPVLEVPWHTSIARPALTPPHTCTMQLSATAYGSWRCSFAQLEAEVLAGLSPEERIVQLCAKMLLNSLKAERWMPRRIKDLSRWWCGRSWNVPVPKSFCLKTSFFRMLEEKQHTGTHWEESDTILRVIQVFEKMCTFDHHCDTLVPHRMKAYFGGECEGHKDATNAHIIVDHLRHFLKRHQGNSLSRHSLGRWCRRWWWWWRWQVRHRLARVWSVVHCWSPIPHETKSSLKYNLPCFLVYLPFLPAMVGGSSGWGEAFTLTILRLLVSIRECCS